MRHVVYSEVEVEKCYTRTNPFTKAWKHDDEVASTGVKLAGRGHNRENITLQKEKSKTDRNKQSDKNSKQEMTWHKLDI